MFPAGRRFGRNSVPPGSFQELIGPSETFSRCAIFVHFARSMVQPPAVAIHYLLDFLGSGGLREISLPPGAQNAENWIFTVWIISISDYSFRGIGGGPVRTSRRPPRVAFLLIAAELSFIAVEFFYSH